MAVPLWLRCLLAAAMLAVAAYHSRRLVAARREAAVRPEVDAVHAGMGVVMAAMLLQVPLAGVWWEVVFAVSAVRLAVAGTRAFVLRGGPLLVPTVQPVIGCAAMVFVLSAAGRPSVMAMGSGGDSSGLSGALAPLHPALLLAVVVTALAALTALTALTALRSTVLLPAPVPSRWAVGCQMAMSVTTVVMLVAA